MIQNIYTSFDTEYKTKQKTKNKNNHYRANGPMGQWAIGPLGHWAIGPLGQRKTTNKRKDSLLCSIIYLLQD